MKNPRLIGLGLIMMLIISAAHQHSEYHYRNHKHNHTTAINVRDGGKTTQDALDNAKKAVDNIAAFREAQLAA